MSFNSSNIALYLRDHPLNCETNTRKKEQYIDFLAYYFEKGTSRLSDSLFSLYKKRFVGEEYEPTPTPSIKGIFKYRQIIYMDVWLINAFGNRERASVLMDKLEKESNILWPFKKKMRQLFECLYEQKGEFSFPKTAQYIKVWKKNEAFLQQPVFKIAFTSNMSAGKSTLINALVGKKVSKSQSMACTAKLHHIYNKPLEDGFSAEDDNILNLDADYITLMTDDEGNESSDIIVSTFFRLLTNSFAPICLLDTPGVNSALDEMHRAITDAELSKEDYDLLVYVINADGSIATDDEFTYMTRLAEDINDKPIVFAVNKLDSFRSDQDSIPESLSRIKTDITKIGFQNALVCPVSAYTGYLAKQAIFGDELDEDETEDLATLRRLFKRDSHKLSKYYPESAISFCQDVIASADSEDRRKQLQLLCDCGILPLEYVLIMTRGKAK